MIVLHLNVEYVFAACCWTEPLYSHAWSHGLRSVFGLSYKSIFMPGHMIPGLCFVCHILLFLCLVTWSQVCLLFVLYIHSHAWSHGPRSVFINLSYAFIPMPSNMVPGLCLVCLIHPFSEA